MLRCSVEEGRQSGEQAAQGGDRRGLAHRAPLPGDKEHYLEPHARFCWGGNGGSLQADTLREQKE